MLLQYLKAGHIISVVSWFAGLLYVCRLFIYHVEAEKKQEKEKNIIQNQLNIMARRLWYGITWPAMIATIGFGVAITLKYDFLKVGWLHIKLAFVLGLVVYHFILGKIRKNLVNNTNKISSFKLRLFNELGTLFLITIVLIAYLKQYFLSIWTGFSIFVVFFLLISAIVYFKKKLK